jgi:hypothetical protein
MPDLMYEIALKVKFLPFLEIALVGNSVSALLVGINDKVHVQNLTGETRRNCRPAYSAERTDNVSIPAEREDGFILREVEPVGRECHDVLAIEAVAGSCSSHILEFHVGRGYILPSLEGVSDVVYDFGRGCIGSHRCGTQRTVQVDPVRDASAGKRGEIPPFG